MSKHEANQKSPWRSELAAVWLPGRDGRTLVVSLLLACVWLSGCEGTKEHGSEAKLETSASTPAAPSRSRHHALTIYGYNYTNRYIDQFTVNGQGGGNLDVSTPTAGGGGRVCCIGWTDGTPLPQTVRVRWVVSACMQKVTSSSGWEHEVPVSTFTEKDVELNAPVPDEPGYFEVHIYPDGHVEVAITADPSEPRLKLDPSREVRGYPACKDKS